jgi:hypothetical protein
VRGSIVSFEVLASTNAMQGMTKIANSSLSEKCLVRDIASASTLSLQDKESFKKAMRSGVVQMPSGLAIRARLILFTDESKNYLTHSSFLADPTRYETTDGKVYCHAVQGMYAKVFKEREVAICQLNPSVADLLTTSKKAELVQVVLFQYRNAMISQGMARLTYLECVIEEALIALHGAEAETEEEEEEDCVWNDDQASVKRRKL